MKYSLFLDSGALPMEQVLFSYRYKIPPYSIVMFPNLHQYRIHRKWKYMNAIRIKIVCYCNNFCMISWIALSFSFLTASHNSNNCCFFYGKGIGTGSTKGICAWFFIEIWLPWLVQPVSLELLQLPLNMSSKAFAWCCWNKGPPNMAKVNITTNVSTTNIIVWLFMVFVAIVIGVKYYTTNRYICTLVVIAIFSLRRC